MSESVEKRIVALENALSRQTKLEEMVEQNRTVIRSIQSQLNTLDHSVDMAIEKLLPKVDALLNERGESGGENSATGHNTSDANHNISANLTATVAATVAAPVSRAKSLTGAAEANDVEMVFALLEAGTDVNERNCFGETALHLAALKGHERIVKVLLGSGAPLGSVTQCGRTALHCAAENGHQNVVLTLLLAGAYVDSKDADGHTALLVAANQGHWEVFKLLLNAGAKPEVLNRRNSLVPLKKALEAGEVKIVRMLLEVGKNKWCDQEIWESMLFASTPEVIHVVRETLPPSRWCKVGKMALVNSAKSGRKASIVALLDAGVDINGGDSHNCTALQWVCCFGHIECAHILLERGAHIFCTDIYGDTPLHEAALRNREDCVSLLLEHGADKNIRNRQDKTPFDLAKSLSAKNLLC